MNAHDHNTPEDLRPIENALDTLAAAEQASAPAMFEERLVRAVRGGMESAPVVVARIGFMARVRVAAAVLIVGTIGSLYLARTAPTRVATTTTLEADVNFLLDLRSSDDVLASMGEKIDTLFLDASTLKDDIGNDWSSSLLNDGVL